MSSPTQPEASSDRGLLFRPTDQLIRRQSVKPFRSVDDILGPAPERDPFGFNEEHAAFLVDPDALSHAST